MKPALLSFSLSLSSFSLRDRAARRCGFRPRQMVGDVKEASWFKGTIGAAYVLLWVTYYTAIRVSRNTDGGGSSYAYNFSGVVLAIEVVKWTSALATCLVRGVSFREHFRAGLLYIVPALIYAVYNGLLFLNLAAYDAASLQLLLNFRIVFAAVLSQVFFRRSVSRTRWLAIMLLTAGCIVLQQQQQQVQAAAAASAADAGNGADGAGADAAAADAAVAPGLPAGPLTLFLPIMLVLLQAFLSSLGGVYSEALLTAGKMDLALQNFFLYTFSLVINVLMMAANPSGGPGATGAGLGMLETLQHPGVRTIVLVGALAGISTSVILKYLGAVVKTFLTATEITLTALIGSLFFDEVLTSGHVWSMLLTLLAIVMYTHPKRFESLVPSFGPRELRERTEHAARFVL